MIENKTPDLSKIRTALTQLGETIQQNSRLSVYYTANSIIGEIASAMSRMAGMASYAWINNLSIANSLTELASKSSEYIEMLNAAHDNLDIESVAKEIEISAKDVKSETYQNLKIILVTLGIAYYLMKLLPFGSSEQTTSQVIYNDIKIVIENLEVGYDDDVIEFLQPFLQIEE